MSHPTVASLPTPDPPPSSQPRIGETALVPTPQERLERPPLRSSVPTMMFDPGAMSPPPKRAPTATVALTEEQLAEFRRAKVESLPPVQHPDTGPSPNSVASSRSPSPRSAASGAASSPATWRRPSRPALLALGLGLVLVLGLGAFFGVDAVANNHRWIAPTVLSSSDPRVLQVAATLQQETARKDALVLQKQELETRLREAHRWVELEESFQASFQAALRSDLGRQRAELKRVQMLLSAAKTEAVTSVSSDVNPTSRGADLEARLDAVRRRIQLLETVAREGRAGERAYDVLALRREYDRSVAASDKARQLTAALAKALGDNEEMLRKNETLLASIEGSPYRLAISGDVALGFVPYDNLPEMKPGDPVFGCATTLLFCHQVGTVGEVLSAEVQGAHPRDGHALRGQLVRLLLTEPKSSEHPMLYARHPPL